MSYPNVVGVADGIKAKRGEPTGERCLVVLVKRKLPKSKLGKTEILPREIEGVPIDVVEVGKIEPLPLQPRRASHASDPTKGVKR
jgi:hypothetical protein